MFLIDLELKNFRNYHSLYLSCSPEVNIFFGQNAQGKTNILEAIACLGLGRSFRARGDVELINWQQEACYLKGEFQTGNGKRRIEIGVGRTEKRVKIDQQPVKSGSLFGQVPVVTFAPDDLQLIKGGPEERRDFLDLYLAQIDPQYRFVLYHFNKVLQQRNRLLKAERVNLAELEVWDEQLVAKGLKVLSWRARVIERIGTAIAAVHHQVSGAREEMQVSYVSFANQPLPTLDETELKDLFFREIKLHKNRELERRITLVGPQRDDLRLTLGSGVDLRTYGSQGQQRTAALALKLGFVEKIKEARGEYPILLLDDVMSEFDDDRKQALLGFLIESAQTFMTSTSRRDFPVGDRQSSFWLVDRGAITSCG